MPRTCLACSSQNRTAIDKAIVSGAPLREIAEKSRISISALHRHKSHAGETLALASERREQQVGDGLLDEIEKIRKHAWELLSNLEQSGDLRGRVVALREVREGLETQAKLLALAAQRGGGPSGISDAELEAEVKRRGLGSMIRVEIVNLGDSTGASASPALSSGVAKNPLDG